MKTDDEMEKALRCVMDRLVRSNKQLSDQQKTLLCGMICGLSWALEHAGWSSSLQRMLDGEEIVAGQTAECPF